MQQGRQVAAKILDIAIADQLRRYVNPVPLRQTTMQNRPIWTESWYWYCAKRIQHGILNPLAYGAKDIQ